MQPAIHAQLVGTAGPTQKLHSVLGWVGRYWGAARALLRRAWAAAGAGALFLILTQHRIEGYPPGLPSWGRGRVVDQSRGGARGGGMLEFARPLMVT